MALGHAKRLPRQRGGDAVPVIGLCIANKKLAQETEQMISLLLVREAEKNEAGPDGRSGVRDFKTQDSAVPGEVSVLLLSDSTAQESFAHAEKLWAQQPGLSIIYIAQKSEDVFAALAYPFFHVVRGYALEQDLKAAIQKLKRVRRPRTRWQSFRCRNGLVRVKQKDILYLESERHEIRIHCVNEILVTAETLAQCEKKLECPGIARIHKSFLVNLYHVVRLERECLILDNGERLYISRYRYPEVKMQFEDYIRHLDFLQEL